MLGILRRFFLLDGILFLNLLDGRGNCSYNRKVSLPNDIVSVAQPDRATAS